MMRSLNWKAPKPMEHTSEELSKSGLTYGTSSARFAWKTLIVAKVAAIRTASIIISVIHASSSTSSSNLSSLRKFVALRKAVLLKLI